MPDEHLIATTPRAPWLPPGSSAEVWAGDDCAVAVPAIIVRLLLTKWPAYGDPRFFCVPTAKGLDLPTRLLGSDQERGRPSAGLAPLLYDVFGGSEVVTRCVGYVRNVVPHPDTDYPHPTPWAHVPVFVAMDAVEPIVDGEWITLERGRRELRPRHWWPIVDNHLTTAADTQRSLDRLE